MTPPLVSILIPAHNAGRWLEESLDSALAQTWPQIEVTVVDDGSTDDTLAIARRYGRKVNVIAQPRGGGHVARNVALAASQGDYVQYLDADDLIAPDKIHRQMERLLSEPPGRVASCEWARFESIPPVRQRLRPEPIWRDFDPAEWLIISNAGGGMMPLHAWLAPRSVLVAAGPWAAEAFRNQDGEYFARVVLASSGVVFVPGARSYYRDHRDGWSRNRSRAATAGLVWSIESITRNLRSVCDTPRARVAMAASFHRAALEIYPEHASLAEQALARARELGAKGLYPKPNGVFGQVARLIGWKAARRLQVYFARISERVGAAELWKRVVAPRAAFGDARAARELVAAVKGGHSSEHAALER